MVVFVAITAASCGPRGAALGTVSLIGLIVALMARLSIAELPGWLLVIVLAAIAAVLVQSALRLVDHPGAQLARLRRAIRHGMDGVLACVEAAVRRGGWTGADRRALRRAELRLNEAVMLAHKFIASGRSLHLLECELVTERVARVALLGPGPAVERPDLLVQIALLRGRVIAGLPPEVPGLKSRRVPQAGPLAGVLAGMALILGLPDHVDGVPPATLSVPAVSASRWATLEVRPAIQAALATLLAVLAGTWVSSSRWYYAVFAAFALFQGTRSRGELISRALQMMAGTLAGVVVGALVATLLAGHKVLALGAIVAGLFLAFFASTAAYGVMAFWVTVILGLVFGLLGYFPPSLLLLRLKETLVGAGCGILVASIVLARPTPSLVRSSAGAFLAALGPVVREAARPLLGQPVGATLGSLTVALEQRYRVLREAAAPRLSGLRTERIDRALLLLGACEEWALALVGTSLRLQPRADPTLSAIAEQAQVRIDASLSSLTACLGGLQPPTVGASEEPASPAPVPEGDDPAIQAIRLLLRLDSALLHARQRLAA